MPLKLPTVPELAEVLSRITGVPGSSVATITRRLGEAGLIPRGSRGRAAPQIEGADLARILIAIMSVTDGIDGTVSGVTQAVDKIGRLRCHGTLQWSETDNFDNAVLLVPGDTFIDQLAYMIEQCSQPDIARVFQRAVPAVGLTFGGDATRGWLEISKKGEFLRGGEINCISQTSGKWRINFGASDHDLVPDLTREARLKIDAICTLAQG